MFFVYSIGYELNITTNNVMSIYKIEPINFIFFLKYENEKDKNVFSYYRILKRYG